MTALGVDVVEDDRVIVIAVYAPSPTHPPLEYTLTLSIGIHALNILRTTCTSTLASSNRLGWSS